MRKETKTVYISDDGVEFDDMVECIEYERVNARMENENMIGSWFYHASEGKRLLYWGFLNCHNISGNFKKMTDEEVLVVLKWCRENSPKG